MLYGEDVLMILEVYDWLVHGCSCRLVPIGFVFVLQSHVSVLDRPMRKNENYDSKGHLMKNLKKMEWEVVVRVVQNVVRKRCFENFATTDYSEKHLPLNWGHCLRHLRNSKENSTCYCWVMMSWSLVQLWHREYSRKKHLKNSTDWDVRAFLRREVYLTKN